MTYPTLMVHLELRGSNEARLAAAAELAERFDARIIGIAACHPLLIMYNDGYIPENVIEQDRADTEKAMNETEGHFRATLRGRARDLEWRSTVIIESLADYIAAQSRAADLLITGPSHGESALGYPRRLDLGDLVMRVGRPLLVVPPAAKLDLAHVVVGWTDTRESRRAIRDALPLLRIAGHVTLVEIAATADLPDTRKRLDDVAGWLKRHGITAATRDAPSVGHDGERLGEIAQELAAGLLVTGAYGHNRVSEWVLGGVTRDLLARPARCSLMTH